MSILGVVPMAGSGSRLGMPFHKALSPTLTDFGIQPLYTHAFDRLRRIADDVVFVLADDSDPCLESLPGPIVLKRDRGELPSTIAMAAEMARPKDLVAVALPDSIFYPEHAFEVLKDRLRFHVFDRGVLGLFRGDASILDEVELDKADRVLSVTPHGTEPGRMVMGWGCLLVRAEFLAGLTDERPLGPQLGDLLLDSVYLGSRYYDLGTPDRYIAHMDQRR